MAEISHQKREKPALEISVVVPMYNEADNLPGTLLRIAETLEPLRQSFEIVAVDFLPHIPPPLLSPPPVMVKPVNTQLLPSPPEKVTTAIVPSP